MAPVLQSHPQVRASRSRPVRSSRTQVQSYHEDSASEDRLDEDTEPEGRSRRFPFSLRPRDPHRMRGTYREDSSDDGPENEQSEDPDVVLPTELPTRRTYPFPEPVANTTSTRAARTRGIQTRSQVKKPKRPSTKKSLEIGRPIRKRRRVDESAPAFPESSGRIPPWQSLPYHILFDIFLLASDPLTNEEIARRSGSASWLVKVALLCRGFCAPALAALYHSPPLIPAANSHGLLSLLSKPEDSVSMNYANKIKELFVDVETLLVYKSGPALGYFDLSRLIERTPQVKTLRLYHNDDHIVGLPHWKIPHSKWNYPEALFASMESTSIRLRSWDWNGRFMETKRLLPLMLATHPQPSFRGMEELRILHVAAEDLDGDEVAGMSLEREVVMATALKELPDLQRLEFVECSILNEQLLSTLPLNLKSLTINNCDDVSKYNFIPFLASHGHNLRELNLGHNRHLSLSFVVGLGQSCQRLEKLKVDFSMHDWSSYHDVEPHFAELLSSSDIPTWPPTLRQLELIHLRKWDDATAEVFFTSLIEAAPGLRDLRRLVISAILKIGWRDRASFREKWIGNMERVFLRHSAPPDPNRRTIPRPVNGPSETRETTPTRDEGQAHSDAPQSGFSTPSKRKSARIAEQKFSEVGKGDSPSRWSHPTQQPDHDHVEDQLGVQGMCDVVTIRIDNLRPTDTQFNEQDFLDDELSGDEDWNGNDLDITNGGYAW